MSFAQPNGIVGRSGLRSGKALAVFVVLVLSGGALLFAAGEAHAQQRLTPEVHATVAGPERTPVFQLGAGGAAIGTLPAYSSPLQVAERGTGRIPGAEPYPVTSSAPTPALKLLEELYPASWIELLPEAAMSESLGAKFRPDPAYDPALAPLDSGLASVPWYAVPLVDPPPATGPYGLGSALLYPGPMPEPVWRPLVAEEYKPLPWRIEEKPPVLSPTGTSEGVQSAPHQGNGAAEAVPVGPLPPFADRKAPPPGLALQEPATPASSVAGPTREASFFLSSVEAAADGAVETLHGAAVGAAVGVPEALDPGGEVPTAEPPIGGMTESSEDSPTPPSPAPLGGGYFSPSVGGQVGPGGIVPLLICVLAAGLVLLRPLVGRLSWASCELPKPSSVLVLPLERPG